MARHIIIFFSALFLEIGSTMYINSVADKAMISTMYCLSQETNIALPFAGFVADAKTWLERFYLALSSSIGYTVGALISMYFILK